MPNGKRLRQKLQQAVFPTRLSRYIPGNQVTLLQSGEACFPAIEAAYMRAIEKAKSEVILAHAYFLPGLDLRRALIDAAG